MHLEWTPDAALFVTDRVEHAGPFPPTFCPALGVYDEGKLVAGVVLHNYDPATGTIEMSVASDRKNWITRRTLTTVFDYAFVTAGCQMLYSRQHVNNRAARQGLLHLGGTEVFVPRMFGREDDGTLTVLTDDAWFASPLRLKE